MISKYVNKYCCEDISLIENYDKAIADTKQIWHCHHRKEIDENLSLKQIKEQELYYNRPASELIFLTKSEHQALHRIGKPTTLGGKHSKEEIQKMLTTRKINDHLKLLLEYENMKMYTLTNLKTNESLNFIKKTNLAKHIGANVEKVELAIVKNQPIRKRNGEEYAVEYRNIDLGIKTEDD